MSNVQKIGLFGGSFDPIHLGHVEIAQMAIKEIPLDILVVMPAGKAPHHRLLHMMFCEAPCLLSAHKEAGS